MSWSAWIDKVPRADVEVAIDAVVPSPNPLDEFMQPQFDLAKKAAKELAAGVKGDDLFVSMAGHANATKDPPEGWSGDSITVTVSRAG